MLAHLDEVHEQLKARAAQPAPSDAALLGHVAELRALLEREGPAAPGTGGKARNLEARLLALEAEHPRLTDIASRIARALESAGL